MVEQDNVERSKPGMLVDLMEKLDDGDKRELLGYTRCLYWKTAVRKNNPDHNHEQA